MTKEQVFSLIRHILSIIGGLLIARGVATDSLVSDIMGGILAVVAIVWSILDKTFQLGMLEGTLRQVATAVGAFLIYTGRTNAAEQVVFWLGVILTLLPTILGQTDKLWANATPVGGA